VTRLSPDDVRGLNERLCVFEADLRAVTGLDLRKLAAAAADWPSDAHFLGARVAAVPVTTGEGIISGFADCVAAILRHLGCAACVTAEDDARGLQEAVDGGAEAVFLADDYRFIAVNLTRALCVDNDQSTAEGYVTALGAAAGGLLNRDVLLLGLGPVGLAAARCLVDGGALVHVVEPDEARLQAVLESGLKLGPMTLKDGLDACDLILDASPAADLIDAADVGMNSVAAVPGLPSAFTIEAQAALGPRHIHEPLAIGVAVMAARALAPRGPHANARKEPRCNPAMRGVDRKDQRGL